ncbi:MAG: tRNA lysidine(34) synthetase TilS [Fidelibacterota bacterium]|nr:MAG: tRNA lysidine(34) synthetase TilS [Candidatus Neomarinimicrobiota bacterium]
MYDPTRLEPVFYRWGIPLKGSHFLVAFSGGLDSVVLAQSMSSLASGHGFTVTLGHVNHRLRPEADGEEAFCRGFAARLDLPFRAAVLSPGQRKGESVEAWARRERYVALERLRQEAGAEWILTAHHADDQAETVLMRLIQQAPLLSLAGIRPRRDRVLRPLLSFTRLQLRLWAESEALEWVEDPSNTDRRFLRNRLRHGVLSTVMTKDNGARETLLGLSRLAQGYEAHCTAAASELVGLATEGNIPATVEMPVEVLLAVEEDIFKLTIRSVVERFLGAHIQMSSLYWKNFRHFIRAGTVGKVFDLPDSAKVLMDRGRLIFYHSKQGSAPAQHPLEPGRTKWGYHDFVMTTTDHAAGATGLWLRSWRSGDRTTLMPGRHAKLVSDIYINARLNRLEKTHWPLVVTGQEEVVWLPGLGIPRDQLLRSPWRITWQTQIRKR